MKNPDPVFELAVLRAYAAYAHRIDDGDIRAWTELFDEGGVMRVRGAALKGREALYAAMAASRMDGVRSRGRHLIMNIEVTRADSAGAVATADFLHVMSGTGGAYIEMIGRYDSRFVREGDGYAFVEHSVNILVDKRAPEGPLGMISG